MACSCRSILPHFFVSGHKIDSIDLVVKICTPRSKTDLECAPKCMEIARVFHDGAFETLIRVYHRVATDSGPDSSVTSVATTIRENLQVILNTIDSKQALLFRGALEINRKLGESSDF